MTKPKSDLLQGTLDLLILKTLALEPMHGWGITQRIQQISSGALVVNQGSLYPAMLRLEQRGWIDSEWGVSENNRQAKYYKLTRAGRKQLAEETENWRRLSTAIEQILQASCREGHAMLRKLFHHLRPGLRGRNIERELDRELQFHLEMETAENVSRGMSEVEARRAARLSFGGVEQTKEAYRDVARFRRFEKLWQDLRYGA